MNTFFVILAIVKLYSRVILKKIPSNALVEYRKVENNYKKFIVGKSIHAGVK